MNEIKAYVMGIREFRLSFTTGYDDYALLEAYDAGRDLAHRLTLRYWDECSERWS